MKEAVGLRDVQAAPMLDDRRVSLIIQAVGDHADMVGSAVARGIPEDDVAGLPVRLRAGNRQGKRVTLKESEEVAAAAMVDIRIRPCDAIDLWVPPDILGDLPV